MADGTFFQWVTVAGLCLGFLGTWLVGSFMLGRAVEQMRAALKQDIESESKAIVEKLFRLEEKFVDDQRTQDDRFGEVGAAMRQYIADVEKKVREVEIWGRDHFVQKSDLKAMFDQFRSDLKEDIGEIKDDVRRLMSKS